jgi:protein phosphatase
VSIVIDAAVCSNKGRVRGNNEDNFFFNGLYMERQDVDKGGLFQSECRDRLQSYAVSDGMGGVDAGEEAAYTAMSELGRLLPSLDAVGRPDALAEGVQRISDQIYTEAQQRGGKSGATLALVSIAYERARAFNVGDSRVYMMRGGALRRISTDHSEVQRMIAMGILTEEEARTHPKRHMISQFLGMPPTEVRLTVSCTEPIDLAAGDWLLLCSDGLTDMVDDEGICQVLMGVPSAQEASKGLVQTALQNGGKDNVTVLCVRVAQVAPLAELTKLRRLRAAAVALAALSACATIALALVSFG